jgi:DNA invertase Pin-like site-specific DNA recombinase
MKFVAYFRVSTVRQGLSGLGLEAQREIVKSFCAGGEIVASYTDVESGKVNNRIKLNEAIHAAKEHNAQLVIAKLDRLSRNLSFIAQLMDSNVDFVACDMPQANRFTVHVMAALAEQERRLISERTKRALEALKARGVKLGKPENLTEQAKASGVKAVKQNARLNNNNRRAAALILQLRNQNLSFRSIAKELNEQGFRSRYDKLFRATQVRRLYNRHTVK